MLEEPEGDEARVNSKSPKLDAQLEVDIKEEQPSSSTWVARGNKKIKTLHIPERVVSKAFKVMPGND